MRGGAMRVHRASMFAWKHSSPLLPYLYLYHYLRHYLCPCLCGFSCPTLKEGKAGKGRGKRQG